MNLFQFSSNVNCIIFPFTATTISFNFVGPTDTGGIKVKAYAVQFKEISQMWEESRNKSWPVGKYNATPSDLLLLL